MTGFLGVVIGTILLGGAGLGAYFMFKFSNPAVRVREYVQYYKIGRIKQYAKSNDIDLDAVIKDEEERNRRHLKLRQNWTTNIEDEIQEDLGEIEQPTKKSK